MSLALKVLAVREQRQGSGSDVTNNRLKAAIEFTGRVRELRRDDGSRTIWHGVYSKRSEGQVGLRRARGEVGLRRLDASGSRGHRKQLSHFLPVLLPISGQPPDSQPHQ